jgi:CheY-like chemotaxis protein
MAKILIVEDELANAEVAAMVCESAGHSTSVAVNGKLAMDLLQQEHFDLLLVDILMPVMDGETLIRLLRLDARFAQTPIIVLTAMASVHNIEELKSMGADYVIPKPYRARVLLDHIVHATDQKASA